MAKKFNGKEKRNVQVGSEVEIVIKDDQHSGSTTEGIVKRVLSKAANHSQGVKVELETGEIGRVVNVYDDF